MDQNPVVLGHLRERVVVCPNEVTALLTFWIKPANEGNCLLGAVAKIGRAFLALGIRLKS